MDDLRHLGWFLEVAKAGSFSGAASKIGVATASVSQSIAKLERDLGVRLFNRNTRQIQLTTEGRMFLERVQEGLAKVNEAVALLDESRDQASGRVSISMVSSFSKSYLMGVYKDLLKRYPKISVELSFSDGWVDLIKENHDIAIVRAPLADGNYVSRRLCTVPIMLFASPEYLRVRGIPGGPEDFGSHEWITMRRPRGSPIFKIVPRTVRPGDEEAHAVTLPTEASRFVIGRQLDAVTGALLAGLGIGVHSLSRARRFLETGQLKIVLPDYCLWQSQDIHIQYPHREYLPRKVRVVLDYLIERFGNDPEIQFSEGFIDRHTAR